MNLRLWIGGAVMHLTIKWIETWNDCELGCGGTKYDITIRSDDGSIDKQFKSGGCFGSEFDDAPSAVKAILERLGYVVTLDLEER